ncbi:TIM barrel protein [Arthrobacter gandavensis]|uniref:TIM barrel protein n=1 Tax=Arthrobacter gandavensis TaxID=169960 RepID=A0ABN2P1G5_9MICC|nr:TIM barrel protein [Arthrobacter citreus]
MPSAFALPSPDLTVNCSIMLADLPLLERPAAAAAAGFDAVEFWWPFESPVPGDREVDAFLASIADAGVRLTGLNFYAGNMSAGERGVLSSPPKSAAFRSSLESIAGIAERTGCRGFNALYGLSEEDVAPAVQADCAVENLAAAADAVAHLGGTVLLEPLSGLPDYPLRTAADCFTVLDRVHGTGRPNIALLADFYHLAVNGEDVPALIAQHAASFGHIQLADAPGRGAPGTGDLPLAEWTASALAGGYSGFISLEYLSPSTEAFAWLEPYRAGANGTS